MIDIKIFVKGRIYLLFEIYKSIMSFNSNEYWS